MSKEEKKESKVEKSVDNKSAKEKQSIKRKKATSTKRTSKNIKSKQSKSAVKPKLELEEEEIDETLDEELLTETVTEELETESIDEIVDEIENDEEDTKNIDDDMDVDDEEDSDEDVDKDDDEENGTDDFVNLYKSEPGESDIDMTTLDRGSSRKNLVTIFAIVIIVLSAVAAGLGYLIFGANRVDVEQGKVSLSISTVETIASGDQIELEIVYENSSNSTIEEGTIEVLYPQGFYFRSSDPQPVDASSNKWTITNVPSGSKGTISVIGQIVGQKDETKDFTSLLTYTPANFTSDFQVSEHTSVLLDESIIQVEVNVQERAHTGEAIQYVYTFTNTSAFSLVNLKALLVYPTGFRPVSASPSADQGNHTWLVSELAPGESNEVKVNGEVTGDGGTIQNFVLQVGIQEPDGFFNVQAEASNEIEVVNPELSMQLMAPEFAQPGDNLEYAIEVQNTSEATIENLELRLKFDGELLDGSEVELDTIELLAPGESKQLTYNSTLRQAYTDETTDIKATLSVINAQVNGGDVEFEQTSEAITRLQGNVQISAVGRYYDDDLTKLGTGPLPPQVGNTTEFVIRWYIESSGGDMDNLEVKTTLPDGVLYIGSSDDRVSYDVASSTVTLDFKSMKANQIREIDFIVSVTPTSQDVGKLLVLTNESILSAIDANSNEAIQAQANKVTSHLITDPGVTDDGVVVKKP
ncbi:MAG: hypothetical protein Q8P90_03710 [bacterium]|nr:hypothetical protein [bacterium]